MAAEAISLTFFESVLKGLHKSPQIITDPSHISEPGVISVSDVSCLVIPDGCMGCVPRSVEKNGALHSVIRVSYQAVTSACSRTSLRRW